MKQINIYFEDAEFNKLMKKKEKLSWHDFILTLNDNENTETKNEKTTK